jgi:epoxyqueuosine reductase
LKNAIKDRALAIGFDLAGVAPISVWDDLAFSRAWVERGYSGSMSYLANPKRHDPRLVLPSAKSVVCVGLVYNAPLPYSTDVGRDPEPAPHRADVHPLPARGRGAGVRDSSEASATVAESGDTPRAWISRYAWGRDYHEIAQGKLAELREAIEALAPGVETRVYVDTGPVVERAFARYSGIGWTAKNTCLISQEKGSWFFIGVVLTNLDLEPDLPASDRCGSCTRCIEACPTGALVEPYVMDASRCIAYFTIELKGSIPTEFRPAIGSNVFGCDICQDVCPWNSREDDLVDRDSLQMSADPRRALTPCPSPARGEGRENEPARRTAHKRSRFRPAATTAIADFHPLEVRPEAAPSPFSLYHSSLRDLTSITEADFRRLFTHSPLKRPKYRGWLRNLCVAIGNSGDATFVPWLERVREHSDPLVREHAEWALERIKQQS